MSDGQPVMIRVSEGGIPMSTLATPGPIVVPVEPVDSGWMPSPLYRMTVEEYEAMVASGAFRGRRRIHLINGLLVERMSPNPPYSIADELCRDELDRVKPAGWHVRSAKPIRLPGQASKPEP